MKNYDYRKAGRESGERAALKKKRGRKE